MSTAPVINIDLKAFFADPYPTLQNMRKTAPIAYVPELDATIFTKRADIFEQEKLTAVYSSEQPDGLMTQLMGENLMRKDGDAHMAERRAIFPTVSPKTVKNIWLDKFSASTNRILDDLTPKGHADLVRDYAMPVSAEALKVITGLTNMDFAEMDRTSQGMMDGIANYTGDAKIEAYCHDCTASIDSHIDAMIPILQANPDTSLLSVQLQAGLSETQVRANIKLAIAGGQNEPRDAIAGAIWALLTHPNQRDQVLAGDIPWLQVFEEYARWISPIGMTPRRVAQTHIVNGITLSPNDRVFFMFSAANRDEDVFENPDTFDLTRDTTKSIAFGAGPHFCAGAWASHALIAEVALPMAFARLKNLRMTDGAIVSPVGWAFRGLTKLPCQWDI